MINFTENELWEIESLYKSGMSMVNIGKRFGVSNVTIKNRL